MAIPESPGGHGNLPVRTRNEIASAAGGTMATMATVTANPDPGFGPRRGLPRMSAKVPVEEERR
jgi:hypothetical protein